MSITREKKPSIRGLARQLSLSVGTISRALNDDPHIRQETRQRVMEAVARSGYVPNQQARALRMQKTHRIGLILPTLLNPVYPEKIAAAQETAQRHGYDVAFACTEWDANYGLTLVRRLVSQGIDGLIVMDDIASLTRDPRQTFWSILSQRQIPLVTVSNLRPPNLKLEQYASLWVDVAQGMERATNHLLELGHRQLGVIGIRREDGPHDAHHSRMVGIERSLARAGLSLDDCLWLPTRSGDAPGAYHAVQQHLASQKPRSTAWLAVDDQVAIGAMAAFQDQGLRVPQDVSIIGFDNTLNAQYCRPVLTTVSQTHMNLGKRAIEMMIQQIDTPDQSVGHVDFSPMLIVGASTGPARRQGAAPSP